MALVSSLDEAKKYHFLWVWKFLLYWNGTKEDFNLQINYCYDYEDTNWQIEFRKFKTKEMK